MALEKNKFKRLSKSVTPSHYDITLQPDLDRFIFSGKETISVNVSKSSHHIILNCLDIDISLVKFTSNDGSITEGKVQYREEEETVKLKFEDELAVGCGKLYIEFTGVLNDKLRGFYRSAQGTGMHKQYAAVTHFEPTGARRAFPCWDEPAVKCTFNITLIATEEKTTLSNMNVLETNINEEGLKVVNFATTPKMSTYLVAFVVGDFDYVEDKSANDILVRVYTSVGKSEQGKYALSVARDTIQFYELYFGIPYGLPKLDMIGIADYGIGAMENWGLVTYRERYMLFDENNTAASTKQRIAEIIGHELAHNWFGNLVTMEWWTHLWLKEGFANFIEYLCVDHLVPEYDIWSQFVYSECITAQKLDALSNSHPIEVPVGHPSEIDEIFDRISYSKGASVLRMLYHYIGAENFKTGLHEYLKKHQFKNTVTEDLWEQLEITSKKPVGRMMSTWTTQMGFPVISVKRESIGENRQVLKLTQTKFNVGDQITKGYRWMVPINITTSRHPNEPIVKVLMSDPDMVIYLDNVTKDDWIKLNPGQSGYYRVKYSKDMLDLLMPAVKSKELSNKDRLGIQNDTFAMAYAGYSSISDYIQVLGAYTSDTDYIVWTDILSNISKLMGFFERTDVHDQFKSFVLSLITPVAETLGYDKRENEEQLVSMLRNSVYTLLGTLGYTSTVKRFQRLFNEHINGAVTIDTDIRSAVYATVATHGNQETLQQLKDLYLKADIVDEKQRILGHLGRIPGKTLKNDVLEFSISDDVRNQDTVLVVAGCLTSVESNIQTWQFIKANWNTYDTRCSGGFARTRLIVSCTNGFATSEELQDIQAFFDANPVPMAERAIKQSIETIRHNIGLVERLSVVF